MFLAPARTCKAVGAAASRAPSAWHRGCVPSVQCLKVLGSVPARTGRRSTAVYAAEAPDLPPLDAVEADGEWIASVIQFWLNEEWATAEVHEVLGAAAGEAYVACRGDVDEVKDYRDLVLALAFKLEPFPHWRDTFVNNFEIGNKIVEVLMLRAGADECSCSSDTGAMLQRHSEGTPTKLADR